MRKEQRDIFVQDRHRGRGRGERKRDRQTDRQRQTNTETDRKTEGDRQTGRQIERETKKKTQKKTALKIVSLVRSHHGLTTGYIQTPGWRHFAEKGRHQISRGDLDSWVKVSIPPAYQVMVSLLDRIKLSGQRRDCKSVKLQLLVSRHKPSLLTSINLVCSRFDGYTAQ